MDRAPIEKQRLAAILAADVEGYTRHMTEDERRTVAALDASRRVFSAQVQAHEGRIVDMTGDSVLAVFSSVTGAVKAAIAVQNELAATFAEVPEAAQMRFRIGIHLGDVLERADGTVYGDGVNIAARLEALAEPGGIAVSDAVFGAVRDKVTVHFDDQGEKMVKNVPRPIKTHFVRTALHHIAPPGPEARNPELRRALPERPSIAVLPFINLSDDPTQEYFADGIVEDIITALSRFRELLVIARNSTFAYKGRSVDVQQVARDLGVRYVLEGSVRQMGQQLRITGQLIDAATRAHLWADRFDGTAEDVFALQDRITDSVVGALLPTLRMAEMERSRRKPPASLDAYDYVLRTLPFVIANNAQDAGIAIQLLGEALRLDPDYAYAHALIATAHAFVFRSAADGQERERARQKSALHAHRALALGSDDSVTLALAGFMLWIAEQDIAAARTALDKAVLLNPNCALALGRRSLVLAMLGEAEPAMEDARRSLRLSPLDPMSYLPQTALVIAHVIRSEYDAAVEWGNKAMAVNPRYPLSHAFVMVAECARGRRREADRVQARLAALTPGFGPELLAKLFNPYFEPLRERVLDILRDAGLVPPKATAG